VHVTGLVVADSGPESREIDDMSRNGSKAAAPAARETPVGISDDAVQALSASFTRLLADMFALYIKTKNFHWHVSGPHFRDYHLLLDDQSEQIFATTDAIAERVRKEGGTTIRSIGHIAQRVCATTMRPPSDLPTCWKNCAGITSFWWQTCARRTRSATRRVILPARAFSRIGSMKASKESGFCSRRTRWLSVIAPRARRRDAPKDQPPGSMACCLIAGRMACSQRLAALWGDYAAGKVN
jgi:hypothetical protein